MNEWMNEYAALVKWWQEKADVLYNAPVLLQFYQPQIHMASSEYEPMPPQ